MPRLAPVTRTVLSAMVITPSCTGGARRAQSPPCGGGDPANGRNPSPPPNAAPGAGSTLLRLGERPCGRGAQRGVHLAAGIPLTDFCSGADGSQPERG